MNYDVTSRSVAIFRNLMIARHESCHLKNEIEATFAGKIID